MLQQSSGGQNHGNNATFGQQKSNADNYLQQQSSFNRPNQTNNLQHQNQQKTQAELIATGYKMTQNQPQKKQFPSSS